MIQQDFLKKLNKKTAQYSLALMNNTKWREILALLDEFQLSFQIATVWNDSNFIQEQGRKRTKNNESYLFDSHTADVYTGGPLYYQEIFAIRIQKFEQIRNPKTGVMVQDDGKFNGFLISLYDLGQLPILDYQDYIVVQGYQV